jgi:1-phosphofructokinase family hexose kinase
VTPNILRVLVVNPNLCFDRTLRVERFEPGAVVRPHDVAVTVGGKGVNVCRAVGDLGGRADLVGFVGEADRTSFTALAADDGLRLHTVAVPGAVRQATIIIEDSGRATVLNEPGPLVGEDDAARFLDRADALMARRGLVACSGSLPPGLPTDLYGRITRLARDHGALSVVDAARAALADALVAEPDLVTPNLHEVEGVLGGRMDEASHDDAPLEEVRERAFASAAALLDRGARRALVTAGAHGAAFLAPGERLWVDAPKVEVANPIGAGDALVGGLLVAIDGGAAWPDAVRYAVAVASAAVEHPVAGRLDAARVSALAGGERIGS